MSIKMIVDEWMAVEAEVKAERAEQDARERRQLGRLTPTAADRAYYSAYKTFCDLACKTSLTIDMRDHFAEGGSVKDLKAGIDCCIHRLRERQETRKEEEAKQRAADGLPPKTWAEIAKGK